VAHIWLGWALIRRPRYTFGLAIVVSVVEIVIVVTKCVGFLSEPQWDIWRTKLVHQQVLRVGVPLSCCPHTCSQDGESVKG